MGSHDLVQLRDGNRVSGPRQSDRSSFTRIHWAWALLKTEDVGAEVVEISLEPQTMTSWTHNHGRLSWNYVRMLASQERTWKTLAGPSTFSRALRQGWRVWAVWVGMGEWKARERRERHGWQ